MYNDVNSIRKLLFSQELPVRVNANGHVYGQVDLDDDSDKSNSNYQRPYGVARRPSVLLSPDYTGKCVRNRMGYGAFIHNNAYYYIVMHAVSYCLTVVMMEKCNRKLLIDFKLRAKNLSYFFFLKS